MQRASGQSDDLTRVPRTEPRQSRGRRSFAARHWRRAAPRCSRGMEPTVRNPRIEPAIASEAAQARLSAGISRADRSVPSRNPVARNGIFGCGDRRPKIDPRDWHGRQRPKVEMKPANIRAETTSFRSTMVSAVREDWMVVCAVRYEPLSVLISALLQGIFANCCPLSENALGFAVLIQWLPREFPKDRNRPFLAVFRGRFPKIRGESAPNRRLIRCAGWP